MVKKHTLRSLVSAALGIAMIFCIVPAAGAGQQGAALKQLLQLMGYDMEVIALDRADGFSEGLYVGGPERIPVIIAVSNESSSELLISISGDDALIDVGDDRLEVIKPEQVDVGDVLCVASAIITFVEETRACTEDDNICYVTAIFNLLQNIYSCIETA
jgi:hypothetical protein